MDVAINDLVYDVKDILVGYIFKVLTHTLFKACMKCEIITLTKKSPVHALSMRGSGESSFFLLSQQRLSVTEGPTSVPVFLRKPVDSDFPEVGFRPPVPPPPHHTHTHTALYHMGLVHDSTALM